MDWIDLIREEKLTQKELLNASCHYPDTKLMEMPCAISGYQLTCQYCKYFYNSFINAQ